ncbi:MAG: substrate-binding domain-containing protein [Oscillospiraceae bacterium]|nr:substrate-binding domain-containing protein [Oscillospiraceae bacterium]
MKRKKIAVITARADDAEQKEIICGIAEAALSANADVAVYSNIYNHITDDEQLKFENIIYDLFEPDSFDGAVITAEAFMDMCILDNVIDKLKKAKLPTVVVGRELEGFESILSDDSDDMEKITEHLISVHGFADIDILTGHKDNPVSDIRVDGCRKAFGKYGIAFDENKVHYGNFWNDSGDALAQRYISGELPFPQAVICTNDYMAWGLCDALTSAGIAIPETVTVTGYDYTGGRIYHYPILTTFRQNRRKTGIDAVNKLLDSCYPSKNTDRFIRGNTCSCGTGHTQLAEEMKTERINQYHTIMNSVAQFSSRLTLCRTLAEYTAVINDFFYLLHNVRSLCLCLDTAWNSSAYEGKEFLCCRINGEPNGIIHEKLCNASFLTAITEERETPSVFYLSPVHFQTRLFGYTVLCCDYPAGYDFSFRDWNKTISNALEFLRMKNDIHYLTQCQRVSSLYDSLTGFYNLKEFKEILGEANRNCSLCAVKMSFSDNGEYIYGENYRSDIISAAAASIKKSCSVREICCRADDDTFIILSKSDTGFFTDRLKIMLDNEICVKFDERQVIISYAFCGGRDIKKLCDDINSAAEADTAALYRRKQHPHYSELLDIRSTLIKKPHKTPDLKEASRRICVSEGYFRSVYKQCFGASYNQDCINARISNACYLLCTTAMSIYAIAVKCGYADEKYFSRQFRQITELSPVQYRSRYCQL